LRIWVNMLGVDPDPINTEFVSKQLFWVVGLFIGSRILDRE